MNLYKFLIEKPYVWLITHLVGAQAAPAAEAEIQALEEPLQAAATAAFGTQVGSLLSANPQYTETEVAALIIPGADAAIEKIVGDLKVPPQIAGQAEAYLMALVPELVNAAYTKLTGTPAT